MKDTKIIEILDVTLRDGEQTQGVSFSRAEKLNIAKALLLKLKVDRVEIASARVSKGEFEAVQQIIAWAQKESLQDRIEILGFVDGNKSVDWIRDSGAKTLNLLTKGSKRHLEGQLRKTPSEHFSDISKVLDYSVSQGIRNNVYLEDWSNGFRQSPEYVQEFIHFLKDQPVDRIFLPDTLGVLSPDETYSGISMILDRYPDVVLEFHGHNDYDLSVANCLAAVKAGVSGLHVSVNGLGERAGNSPMEAVITAVHDKTSVKTGVNEKSITEVSRLVEVFSGKRISSNRPIVGEDVFTQTAGVHADGDQKGNLYANPILPERFGRKRVYALGKLAGKASISENLKELGMVLSEETEKKLLERVIELGDQNKIVTPEDLPFLIADISGENSEVSLKIQSCKIESGIGIKPRAFLELSYKNEILQGEGLGDGGYDAFMTALRSLIPQIGLELPELVDYEVRIPPGGKTDALVETMIAWQIGERKFRTIGVDPDQIVAAILATEKMLNLVIPR